MCRAAPLLSLALLLLFAPAAVAVPVDGTLDGEYGAALATQTTQADVWGNANLGLVDFSNGSELDQAYGFIADGVLHLFFTGNLMAWYNPVEAGTIHDALDVLIDSKSGGQNQLSASNPNVGADYLNHMAGMTFDAGFDADYWLSCNGMSAPGYGPYFMTAFFAELPAGGGGGGWYLGQGTAGGPGTLTGGTNPDNILVTINNINTAGVGPGCGAASGVGVTTGIEWAIPLAAIGSPMGCVRVSAFVINGWHDALPNQVLGPIPPESCALGAASLVNFANIAGGQLFTVCPGASPVRVTSWGAVKDIYR